MARIECYNCKKITDAVAPRFRCSHCNYPLYKYIQLSNKKEDEEKVIKNLKEADHSGPGPGGSAKTSFTSSLLTRIGLKKTDPKKEVEKPKPVPKPTYEKKVTPPIVEKKPIVEVKPVVAEKKVTPTPKPKAVEKPIELKKDKQATIVNLKPKLETNSEVIFKVNKNPEKTGKIVAGWLVVHTEDREHITYELFEGDNAIGRHDGPHHVDIEIENDRYISRVHCVIKVKKDYLHRFHYLLVDNDKNRQGKPSTNGTFINGNEKRIPASHKVFLKDGDIVQVGETKLAFKSTSASDSFEDAANSVLETDYTKTVAIKMNK